MIFDFLSKVLLRMTTIPLFKKKIREHYSLLLSHGPICFINKFHKFHWKKKYKRCFYNILLVNAWSKKLFYISCTICEIFNLKPFRKFCRQNKSWYDYHLSCFVATGHLCVWQWRPGRPLSMKQHSGLQDLWRFTSNHQSNKLRPTQNYISQ